MLDERDRVGVGDGRGTARRSRRRRDPERVVVRPVRPISMCSNGSTGIHPSAALLTGLPCRRVSFNPSSTGQYTERLGVPAPDASHLLPDLRRPMMRSASWPDRRGSRLRPSSRPGPRRWRPSSAARRAPSTSSGGPRTPTASSGRAGRWTEVTLLAPVPRPGKVVAIGRNYRDHAAEAGSEPPAVAADLLASGPARSSARATRSAGTRRSRPRSTTRPSWAWSSAGPRGGSRRRTPSSYVLGYTCIDDVSARDLQFGDGQWVRGKSLDTFCPMGPVARHDRRDPRPADARHRLPRQRSDAPAGEHRRHVLRRRDDRQPLLAGVHASSRATSSRRARRPASASSATRRSCSATATRWSSRSRGSAGSSTPAGSSAPAAHVVSDGAVPRHGRPRVHRRLDGPGARPRGRAGHDLRPRRRSAPAAPDHDPRRAGEPSTSSPATSPTSTA